ncbi:hypothetical protein CIHG_04980 [Coccidioides immitis H538.4]|uniref:Uncharacterized protein n=2 Tax=Coccidioides immitis TaxID=5501 RepID=A0A0J8RSU9_COCIT|nr:hypothetical protein CIRG_03911 [Coccidioides immitis RMSCC 2394]KMU87039.1 hypothetical protein CIHG_04980 [Coccidioides immitis H538.4]
MVQVERRSGRVLTQRTDGFSLRWLNESSFAITAKSAQKPARSTASKAIPSEPCCTQTEPDRQPPAERFAAPGATTGGRCAQPSANQLGAGSSTASAAVRRCPIGECVGLEQFCYDPSHSQPASALDRTNVIILLATFWCQYVHRLISFIAHSIRPQAVIVNSA